MSKDSLEEKLAKIGALAILAAHDFRTGKNEMRLTHLLETIDDWAADDEEIGDVIEPHLRKLGKRFGFEVSRGQLVGVSHPGNKERH